MYSLLMSTAVLLNNHGHHKNKGGRFIAQQSLYVLRVEVIAAYEFYSNG